MVALEEGIVRITLPLPFGIDHVHCYLLRAARGGWILVDTGLGSGDPERRWSPLLASLDAPIERIVVTHMHPDHVGGARDVAELTGAEVWQGREDHEQCRRAWGPDAAARLAAHWRANGLPPAQVDELVGESMRLAASVHWAESPRFLEPGDELDGWRVELLRGHADGHVALLKDGVMIAGDSILAGITPVIGLYPDARPDPLGDYLKTLARIEELAPAVAYSGHRDPVRDPSRRAREIRAHHDDRLARTRAALDRRALTAYELSLELFPDELSPAQRRFALAESLAHLERIVRTGGAERADGAYVRRERADTMVS